MHENQKAFSYLMKLMSFACDTSYEAREMFLMKESMRRFNVKPIEAIEGFWRAYSDPYVKDGRIEWRNLWKHIQEYRNECYIPPKEPQTMMEYQEEKAKRLQGK